MVHIQWARHCYQALFNTAIVWELIAFWFSPTIYCLEVSERPELNRITSIFFTKKKTHKMWHTIVNYIECYICFSGDSLLLSERKYKFVKRSKSIFTQNSIDWLGNTYQEVINIIIKIKQHKFNTFCCFIFMHTI